MPRATPSTPRPEHDVKLETTIGSLLSGRYRLDEQLGEGGMGIVFRATDLRMPGVRIAVKLLKPEFRERPELLNILQESVRKVRSIPHPAIAGVYSVETDGERDFVIMELLQGQTLHTLLDNEYARGVPIGLARTLIDDLCSALAYAHDHNVIHSDIKPANIFVTPSGHAKLFDFDIARVLRGSAGYFDASRVGAVTRAYASIEMEDGGEPDPRDDVYALACVIYEMLGGKHPFGGASALQARLRGLQVKPLPMLRRDENCALVQALSFDREQRLATVEALRNAFGFNAAPRAAWPLRPRWVIAGVAGVLLCTGLSWWYLRPPPRQQQMPAAPVTAELGRAKNLAARARELAVDERDESLRRAVQLLASVRELEDPGRALRQAQSASAAFLAAIARSPRVARLGTDETQLKVALELCRQLRLAWQHCSAKSLADEAPRAVSLRPFGLDATPVTNEEFARFVQATGRRTAAEIQGVLYSPDPAHGRANVGRGQNWRTLRAAAAARGETADALPVLGVDLESARAYCEWKNARLPTEDEWEYSARGPSGRVFPWGDQREPPAHLPNRVLPVSQLSRVGNADSHGLGGNVAEWTESRIEGEPVLRGGSWLLPQPYFQRLALRRLASPGAVLDGSFRCAKSMESWPGSTDPVTVTAH